MTKKTKNITEGFLLAIGEIFLKSEGVQKLLMQRLVNNISFFLKKENINFSILNLRTRIFIKSKPRTTRVQGKKIINILKKTFGLVWFSQVYFLENYQLKDVCLFVKENYSKWIKEKESFALRIKKDSNISEKTNEIIDNIAKEIKRKVNLNKPQKEIFIERRKLGWFIYFKKQKGAGGLPLGSQGKVLVLTSGGIDSPVASWLVAKRGAENVWIHFHSFPIVSKKSIEKVKKLADAFLNLQPRLKIYFVAFGEIQQKIKNNVPAKYRILLYRRAMLKISQKIAKGENCRALATGESLGQVSSQTLVNLEIIEEAVKIPVLRPLISLDKEEIINMAKELEVFDISILPQEDCCSLFVPSHATAHGNMKMVKDFEKELKLGTLLTKAMKRAEIDIHN